MKKHILLIALFWLVYINVNSQAKFTYEVIDSNPIGHREIADTNNDGKNDIIALYKFKENLDFVYYAYPNWEKYTLVDIRSIAKFKSYASCDMEVADIDGDGDFDIVGRLVLQGDSENGVICWFET